MLKARERQGRPPGEERRVAPSPPPAAAVLAEPALSDLWAPAGTHPDHLVT